MTFNRHLLVGIAAVAVAVRGAASAPALEPWLTAAGYQQLLDARGPTVPLGVGAIISQVEAPEGSNADINNGLGRYVPFLANPDTTEFDAANDPLGQAVQLVDGSGYAANGTSGHAGTQVGRYIYGNSFGLARAATPIVAYDVNRWLTDQLHFNNSSLAPNLHTVRSGPSAPITNYAPFQVQNHSWVSLSPQSYDLDVLRRFDYAVDADDATAVVGLNNNTAIPNLGLTQPTLLAHSYNAIAVGRTDSAHSRGMTGATGSTYGPGRFKPDIVSLAGATSVATSQVSSAAALIRSTVAGTAADRSEPTKAILLAGATKTEFANFVEPSTGIANPWNHTTTRPLDDVFGAGELNIFNSYLMTVGGQNAGTTAAPAAPVASYGWDYQDHKNDAGVGDIYYNFVIPTGSKATELSIMLAWNVKVTDTDASPSVFTPVESLQNLDLTFYDSTASFLGSMVDQSVSTIDNVEHIYRTNLGPGTYTLKVSGSANWDFGLAWRMSTLFDVVDADFDDDGFFSGNDFLAWQRNLGKLVGAVNGDGDADGDGDVDSADLALLNYAIVNQVPPPMFLNAMAAVPEPATMITGAFAGGFLALAGRVLRRRRRD